MNWDLMQAILSMDAYNRGYEAGIELSGNQIGTWNIGSDSLTMGTIEVDGQTIRKDQNIGFYALAYSYNGQTII